MRNFLAGVIIDAAIDDDVEILHAELGDVQDLTSPKYLAFEPRSW